MPAGWVYIARVKQPTAGKLEKVFGTREEAEACVVKELQRHAGGELICSIKAMQVEKGTHS
jgi:hypothetical protein